MWCTFLRKAFQNLPILGPFKVEAQELIDEIDKLAPIRATVVHGSISAYDPDTQLIKFVRLPIDRDDDMHTIAEERLSIQQILDAGSVVLNLMTRGLTFGRRLADILLR